MTHAKKHYIYALVDRITAQPFYVGVTCDPKARLKAHLADKGSLWTYGRKTRKQKFICSLGAELIAVVILGCEPSREAALKRERETIVGFRSVGHDLTNDDSILRTAPARDHT